MKYYLFGFGLLALALTGLYVVHLLQENERLEISNIALTQTVARQSADIKRKEEINAERQLALQDAQRRSESLRRDLSRLQRTEKQIECDAVALPAGYLERLRIESHSDPTP